MWRGSLGSHSHDEMAKVHHLAKVLQVVGTRGSREYSEQGAGHNLAGMLDITDDSMNSMLYDGWAHGLGAEAAAAAA